MALESLLYISESKMDPDDAQLEVGRILATSHAFNPSAGITGALIFTGTPFAQLMEGDEEAVSSLIDSISRDTRHTHVDIVTREPIGARRFPDWSMAYNGPSQFVSRHVTRLLNDPSTSAKSRGAEWLTEVLEQFSGLRNTAA